MERLKRLAYDAGPAILKQFRRTDGEATMAMLDVDRYWALRAMRVPEAAALQLAARDSPLGAPSVRVLARHPAKSRQVEWMLYAILCLSLALAF
ncbi:hypothetical protein [Nitrospirillum amazonense]|uniref:hypothetical protein n=1 Tax=Nitrospirillum amazonense TaxID=28077 RepID=UPI0024122CEE|nr:hypothetical protein [Nitrospirillum amazonense]MDG3440151.1 hypothetical protein [Nitrospirillum amazonense]